MEFTLRPWSISDLDSLVKHANNWNVAKNLTDSFPYPYTYADGKQFIEMANLSLPIHVFAIEMEGQAIGAIGTFPQTDIHKKNIELGYWLAEEFWGRNIISQAIKNVVDFAFLSYNIERIFARPFGTNLASQRVLEKNNFILEGRFNKVLYKNGEYLDELIYALRRDNWNKENAKTN